MDKPRVRRKRTAVNRYIVPVAFIVLLMLVLIVFTVTFMSIAGLTPGA